MAAQDGMKLAAPVQVCILFMFANSVVHKLC